MNNSQNLYLDLEKFIKPKLLDDFCGYDEESQSFNIVLAVKQIIEAKEQECEIFKKQKSNLINTCCHFKNETKNIRRLCISIKLFFKTKLNAYI